MKCKTTLIGMLLVLSPGLTQPRNQPEVSVCEILKNPDRYDGKVVPVRGRWMSSSSTYLASTCTRGRDDLDLPQPYVHGISIMPRSRRNQYRPDAKSEQVLESAMRAIQAGRHVRVTLVGRVEVLRRGEYRVGRNPYSGSPITRGYGHLGRFPARIAVREAKNLEIY